MMADAAKSEGELNLQLREYLSAQAILIVDGVSSARFHLAKVLVGLGAVRAKVFEAGTLSEARAQLEARSPKIIFTDFHIGADSGLDLLEAQKMRWNESELKQSLFILVTSNASQSVVARAAEEDVDTFILKPYTKLSLTAALAAVIDSKFNPNRYLRMIEEGKELTRQQKYHEAISVFMSAMEESQSPTLACFYAGQAHFHRGERALAEASYGNGLSFHPIHYKCLVGLYDLHISKNDPNAAYQILRTLSQYFPASPNRLTQVLRLSVITEHFEDIEGYHQIYLRIAERESQLIKTMCSALVVTGKHYLRMKIQSKAMPLFESAAIGSPERTNFLAYIIEALVDFKMNAEVQPFFKRLSEIAPESREFAIAKFLISTLGNDLGESLKMGKSLIDQNVATPSVYKKLIALSLKSGDVVQAKAWFQAAGKQWPEQAGDFVS